MTDEKTKAQPGWRIDRDFIIASAAILVSACALVVSLVQTRVMMAQRDAAVWPRVSLYSSVRDKELIVGVRNSGVGPAIVNYAQARLGTMPMATLNTLVDSAPIPADWNSSAEVTRSNLTGSVVAAGEQRELLHIKGDITRYVVTLGPRVSLDACYCSVFEKCWTLRVVGLGEGSRPPDITPATACKEPAGALF